MEMNIRAYFLMGSLALCMACQSGNRNETAANDTMLQADRLPEDQEQKYCFLRTEGTQRQDSSYVQLVIRGETVSGIYNTIPHEKDARRGTVLGQRKDHVFDLVWTYSQEGMQDTMRVVFTLRDGKLMQKPLSVDSLTGRQVTRDTSGFSVTYEPVDCAAD
ncbi:hypothetical protein JHJ32_15815 [Parapedobacter sp. ISTM3]|uniref:hypothetical protein n=1 Tax=Parapedobacter sp. ISTM3 TaxID=2800130 RepID=UPI001902C430|nr:hypothetical protein [Parapedobacter sp. ISTM3]MBK1441465.1 hypothetical protein [Parapedobacter sp. ISTM3]